LIDYLNLSKEELEKYKFELESEISKLNNNQMARKVLLNSEYGAIANIYFRYFDIRLASAITLGGQLAIRWIEKYLMKHPLQKKYMWDVIYEDTDSLYLSVEKLSKALEKKYDDRNLIVDKLNEFSAKIIQPIIDKGYKELAEYVNANENRMFMKQEKLATKALWTGKKKYALLVIDNEGVRYKEPKLKVKGIETVRSSTPKFVREKLRKVITLILTDKEKLNNFIEETKKEFLLVEPESVAFTVSVNTLNKYETVIKNHFSGETELSYKKRTPIGVRAAIVHNKYIIKNNLFNKIPEINVGDKIKYLYLKEPNPLHENIIGFIKNIPDKDKLKKFVDYNTQFYKTFLKPIENITTKINLLFQLNDEFNIHELFD